MAGSSTFNGVSACCITCPPQATGTARSTEPAGSRSDGGVTATSVGISPQKALNPKCNWGPAIGAPDRQEPSTLNVSELERSRTAHPAPDKPLRIAFFTDSFPPTHDGVAEVTAALGTELSAQGHEITVFTVRSPGQKRRERLANGVTVRRHLALAAPSYPEYRVALLPYAPLFLSRRRFDLVHIHTPGFVGLAGYLASRRWGTPSIGTFHSDLRGMLAGAGKSAASRAFFRAWARFNIDLCVHCDAATAPTSAARAQLDQGRICRRPPVVIKNGVDLGRFRPGVTSPDWHARLGTPPERPFVTFLGRLTRDKGVLRFLDAIEELPTEVPLHAIVGGSGPLRGTVAARFSPGSSLANRGSFVGVVPDREKPALLAQTRVFVLPSLSDTSSIALLEAMACGAGCVVTNRGGPAEIARASEAAVLVEPEDVHALSRAIQQLLEEPARTQAMAATGMTWVGREASIQRSASLFVRLYRETLAERERVTDRSPSQFGNDLTPGETADRTRLL
jgi:glycosyltransferase involved in cell wall biosynthesis